MEKEHFQILSEEDISAIECKSDANLTIATTATEKSKEFPTVVIGEDTDLLVLLIHYSNAEDMDHHDLFFKS